MDRIALHTRLVPGRESAYEALHSRVSDALVSDLLAAEVQEWRIWRDGSDLFHHIQVADRARMRTMMRASSANIEWQQMVSPLLNVAGAGGDLPLIWSLRDQVIEGRR